MKIKFTKYIVIILGILISLVIYLSIFGIETDKLNNKIIDKIKQINPKLDVELKKIKISFDPLRFKINAKTIGAQIIYQKKILELEYIKTQISLSSIFKNKFTSSNLEVSTKSILLKDLVTFSRLTTNRTELFLLERMIDEGYVIIDIFLNFDEDGKIKNDYEIKGILKDASINFLKNYNFEKINLLLNIKNDIFKFNDIKFITNGINFDSKNLKVIKYQRDFIFEGDIENKDSSLNKNINYLNKFNIKNINFGSKNDFSFKIDNKFNFKDLIVNSVIVINEFEYKKPYFISEYFPKVENVVYLKDHKIKASYKKDNYSVKGQGKVKLQKQFDKIDYIFNSNNKNSELILNIALSELNLKKKEFLENFFPNLNKELVLKDNQVEISYNKENLSIKGSGKIQSEKVFDEINYSIIKKGNEFKFDTNLILNETALKIDYLNFENDTELNTQIKVVGSYKKNKEINLKKISIENKNSQIKLSNLLLDNQNKMYGVDKIDLNYIDIENKRNQLLLQKKQKNEYELNGLVFNANSLISDLLKNGKDNHSNIFKNDMNLNLNLEEVYIDEKNIIKDMRGKILIQNNKVVDANLSAFFDDNKKLSFVINTINGKKITTLFSPRAKPLVKRYKFIKGYEEGYLDFFSSKQKGISVSTLNIYDFKLQELPALTKLLTLASLQGIADILSGEGIRFDEFEMKFKNEGNLMTISEIYAIGPAISILMKGYVEQDKLISLRGTMVPATTINKTISNIPFLGKILVGDKTGEGVFGVSFKIKGPPKKLETTVNPIKTLTPRFITRTLEKIKNN